MLPIGVVGKNKYRAYMSFTLIMINVVVFIWELTLMMRGEEVFGQAIRTYAMNVCAIGEESVILISRNAIFTMFLHGSLLHLFGNMLFLWIFAPKVEEYFGHWRFLFIYVMAGFGATIAHIILGGVVCSPTNPYAGIAIGASGAISGVMGAFLLLYPGAKIETLVLFFRVIFPRVRVPAFVYLGFYFVMDFLNAIDASQATNVAHWAHIGGFVTGALIIFIAMNFKQLPPVDPLGGKLDE